jgi:hypothetical protein
VGRSAIYQNGNLSTAGSVHRVPRGGGAKALCTKLLHMNMRGPPRRAWVSAKLVRIPVACVRISLANLHEIANTQVLNLYLKSTLLRSAFS